MERDGQLKGVIVIESHEINRAGREGPLHDAGLAALNGA
jgi:hypothetical protein